MNPINVLIVVLALWSGVSGRRIFSLWILYKTNNWIFFKGQQKGSLVWSDEFNNNGGPDPSKWNTNTDCNGCGNNELQFYKPSGNAVCNGGFLTITAKRENANGRQYTSAKLVSKQEWKYGVFEARIKSPKGRGNFF